MVDKEIIEGLKNICEDVSENVLMKEYTNFKIGGPRDVMIIPKSEEEVVDVVKYLKTNKVEFFILGNGSNLLVRDKGIRGAVIYIGENLSKVEVNGEKVYAQGGALLNYVSKMSFKESLTGMEGLSGIPGSIGGAITMNAGAYGTEMIDVIESVKVVDKKGNIKEFSNEEMHFGYRHSRVKEEDLLVLSCIFDLKKGDREKIDETYKDLTHRRTSRQPLEKASAGSTFKRPEKGYASQMIEETGLKGLSIGDAQVSMKHAGFIINNKDASCQDILDLIDLVIKKVNNKFGVILEPEVIILGEE